jgi:hypothetical protein
MFNKKGQGLSLTTIIVAALALIVLVVLVMVFTGRINVFEKGLSNEGKAELVKMRVTYGDCRPSASEEANFDSRLQSASSVDEAEAAKVDFRSFVTACKQNTDETNCVQDGCLWS